MATQPKHLYTPDEYLALERQAAYKSEYVQGEIFAMSGARYVHNRITMNLTLAIGPQLQPGSCELLPSDQRVHVPATGMFTYPDLIVVCGAPQFRDNEFDTLLNPTLLVEVLSPSTEAYDRGKKFANYRALPSLQQYVLIATDRVSVEVFTRLPEGEWNFIAVTDPTGSVELASIHARINVSAVYRGVSLGDALS
jgi:Uma2 family endonuclease